MSAQMQAQMDIYNIAVDQNGAPFVQRPNGTGGYTSSPVTSGTVAVYAADSAANTASSVLDSHQAFLNGINLSACDPADAQYVSDDIAYASGLIQTARATLAPSDRLAAAEGVGRVLHDLPIIGNTRNAPYPVFFMFNFGNTMFAPHPIDREPKPRPASGGCTRQGPTMKRIAAAAIMQNGMSTANAPGGGVNSCAWAVENALNQATGMYFVGGTGNTNWVPDVSKGLLQNGWTALPPGQQPKPGDVAVQNGWGDGGTPAASTSFENHIGIVVTNPSDGNLAIMNNSSQHMSFTNFDETMVFATYYSGSQDGPPKFYRVPANGIPQQICLGP